jgi:hypothetical protein
MAIDPQELKEITDCFSLWKKIAEQQAAKNTLDLEVIREFEKIEHSNGQAVQ